METVLLGAFFFQELQERLPSVTHILDTQLVLGNTVLHIQVVFPEQGPGDRLVELPRKEMPIVEAQEKRITLHILWYEGIMKRSSNSKNVPDRRGAARASWSS